jgi:hypothetical protein
MNLSLHSIDFNSSFVPVLSDDSNWINNSHSTRYMMVLELRTGVVSVESAAFSWFIRRSVGVMIS